MLSRRSLTVAMVEDHRLNRVLPKYLSLLHNHFQLASFARLPYFYRTLARESAYLEFPRPNQILPGERFPGIFLSGPDSRPGIDAAPHIPQPRVDLKCSQNDCKRPRSFEQ